MTDTTEPTRYAYQITRRDPVDGVKVDGCIADGYIHNEATGSYIFAIGGRKVYEIARGSVIAIKDVTNEVAQATDLAKQLVAGLFGAPKEPSEEESTEAERDVEPEPVCPKCGTAGCLKDKAIEASFDAETRTDWPSDAEPDLPGDIGPND